MDGHNAATEGTKRPCGLIFDRLSKVEKKTDTIMQTLPLYNQRSSHASLPTQSTNAPWEGGFTNLFQDPSSNNPGVLFAATGILGGQQPPNDQHTSSSEVFELVEKLQ